MLLTVVHPDLTRGPGLHPTDVRVEEGLALPEVLLHLARVTGWAGWPDSPVAVGASLLTPGHVSGHYPLVAGCTLRPCPLPRDEVGGRAADALRATWHLAVVAGPDSGSVHRLDPRTSPVRLSSHHRPGTGGEGGTSQASAVQLDVPDWGDRVIHVRATLRRGRTRFHVRVTGRGAPGDPTVALVGPRRFAGGHRARRTVRTGRSAWWHPWQRWDPAQSLHVASTRLALRRSPEATSGTPPESGGHQTGRRRPGSGRAEAVGLLAPAAGSIALAVAMHQPFLLLTALLGPATLLASRSARADPAAGAGVDPCASASRSASDPAALAAASVHALWRAASPPAPGTAGATTATYATSTAGVPASAADPAPGTFRAALLERPGATLALSGPPAGTRAVARALVLGAVGPSAELRVQVRGGEARDWAWTRWLPDGVGALPGADAPPTIVVADLAVPQPTDERQLAELARWRAQTTSVHRLLLLLPEASPGGRGATVPAWCRHVLRVETRTARLHTPDGRVSEVPCMPCRRRGRTSRRAASPRCCTPGPSAHRVTGRPAPVVHRSVTGACPVGACPTARTWAHCQVCRGRNQTRWRRRGTVRGR
ncbi:hypothetical protein [Cellulomonas soli]